MQGSLMTEQSLMGDCMLSRYVQVLQFPSKPGIAACSRSPRDGLKLMLSVLDSCLTVANLVIEELALHESENQ